MANIVNRVNGSKIGQITIFAIIVLTLWGLARRFIR